MHGDGICGESACISARNKYSCHLKGKYCMVVPDSNTYRNMHNEIHKGAAWSKLLGNIRAEPKEPPPLLDRDQRILHHMVQRHCLKPSQALVVCHVLDEPCITALTGGAGTGKS